MAAVGPAAGRCCYEVTEELASEFETQFARDLGLNSDRVRDGRKLDLASVMCAELQDLGLARFESMGCCTICTRDHGEPRFFSYRREAGAGRQLSMIVRS